MLPNIVSHKNWMCSEAFHYKSEVMYQEQACGDPEGIGRLNKRWLTLPWNLVLLISDSSSAQTCSFMGSFLWYVIKERKKHHPDLWISFHGILKSAAGRRSCLTTPCRNDREKQWEGKFFRWTQLWALHQLLILCKSGNVLRYQYIFIHDQCLTHWLSC